MQTPFNSAGIAPFIVGRGGAGLAIARALDFVALTDPDLGIRRPTWLPRGSDLSLPPVVADGATPILFIAGPHGLHAPALLAADGAGYGMLFCEKPTCISSAQADELARVKTPTAVFHGYRQMWGPQTLKRRLDAGEFGDLVTVEGRYWQSSAAARALSPTAGGTKGWKMDPKLAGEYDVFLDLGSHWADLAAYFYGHAPSSVRAWRNESNADGVARDTHVQLMLDFPRGGRGFASVSKNVHGATNGLEIHLVGTKKSASWSFLSPDELRIGTGRERAVAVRTDSELGSHLPPFHGAGWLEGYVEIIRQGLRETLGATATYPRLSESLPLMRALFAANWENRA